MNRSPIWMPKSTIFAENCKFYFPFKNVCLSLITITISFFSVKPTLKKVSKYENKFAKLQKKAAEFNFRNQLKVVKKKEFTLEEEDKEVRTFLLKKNIFSNFIGLQKIIISLCGIMNHIYRKYGSRSTENLSIRSYQVTNRIFYHFKIKFKFSWVFWNFSTGEKIRKGWLAEKVERVHI